MMVRTVKSACVKVAAIAMAALAATATLTVNAAENIYWTGGSVGTEAEPVDIYTASYTNAAGEAKSPANNYANFAVSSLTYMTNTATSRVANDIIVNSGDYVFTGPLEIYAFKAGAADSTVSITKKNGDWTITTYAFCIGNANYSTVVFTNRSGNVTCTGTDNNKFCIGSATGSKGELVNLAGTLSFAGNLNLGYYDGSSGTLTVKGGKVSVGSNKTVQFTKGASTINLDGGVLEASQIYRATGNGTFVQTINFNGGTLKRASGNDLIHGGSGYMRVNVLEGGGTIDCNGNAVTIDMNTSANGGNNPASLPYSSFEGTGGLTFTGGETITVKNDINYTGATYIAAGTTLNLTNATSIATLLSHGVVLVGAPVVGTTYTILTSNEDLSGLTLAGNVTCPVASAFTTDFADGGKSITVTVTALKPGYWTGAAGDNNLSAAGNWTDGLPSGNANIFVATPTTLTKGGDSFAPTSITFITNSAPVTINGDFTTLTCVTNNSIVNHTFAGIVDFGEGNIDVTSTAALEWFIYNNNKMFPNNVTGGCVVFAGGVIGANVTNHSIVAGNYTLTTNANFHNNDGINNPFMVNTSSSLSVKNANATRYLSINEGATFNVGNFTRSISGSGQDNCFWTYNKGTYVITNFTFTGFQGFWLGGCGNGGTMAGQSNGGKLKIKNVTHDGTGRLYLHFWVNNGPSSFTTYIGEEGLNIGSGKTGYYAVKNNAHSGETLRPWNSDFTFGSGSNANYDFLVGDDDDAGRRNNINFTLNTDDEANVPRTITMNARICTTNNTASITVAGHGTNVVTVASPLMTGTYAVTDAATVVLKNGAGFANGTVSVGATATLVVGESATVNPGNLTLTDGATLGFNYTGRSAPVLNLDGKTVTFAEGATTNVTVKVSAAERKRARGGANVLTTGGKFAGVNVTLAAGAPDWALGVRVNGDGNIVLDAQSRNFIMSFK